MCCTHRTTPMVAAASMMEGTPTTPTSLVDYERRSGVGDRFIPSRALSNLNFELLTGGPTIMSLQLTSPRTPINRGGGGGVGSGGNSGGIVVNYGIGFDATVNLDALYPTQSFGATMIGGGTVVEAISPDNSGGAGARGQDVIASAFSDDGAVTDAVGGGGIDRHDATCD